MKQLFAVMLIHGAAYHHGQPLESQVEWDAHAKFMDDLVNDGLVRLGGPLEGTSEVLLVFPRGVRGRNQASPRARSLAQDGSVADRQNHAVDTAARQAAIDAGILPASLSIVGCQ
jgi:hypothetical protein